MTAAIACLSCDPAADVPGANAALGAEQEGLTRNGVTSVTWAAAPAVSTPTAAADGSLSVWEIPANPSLAAEPTELPRTGAVAVGIDGVAIFGPNEGAAEAYGDPVHNGVLDECQGHEGHGADYHLHALAEGCMATTDSAGPSALLGYALDGFPIYGPRGCTDLRCDEVVEYQSGWVAVGDAATYAWDRYVYQPGSESKPGGLDRCNGRIGPDGTYRYHATRSFPYVLGCYAGVLGGTSQPAGVQGGSPDPGGAKGGGAKGGGAKGGGGMEDGCTGGGPTPQPCGPDGGCDGRCPPDAVGCACAARPDGHSACLPTCASDDDCPTGGPVLECGEGGICERAVVL